VPPIPSAPSSWFDKTQCVEARVKHLLLLVALTTLPWGFILLLSFPRSGRDDAFLGHVVAIRQSEQKGWPRRSPPRVTHTCPRHGGPHFLLTLHRAFFQDFPSSPTAVCVRVPPVLLVITSPRPSAPPTSNKPETAALTQSILGQLRPPPPLFFPPPTTYALAKRIQHPLGGKLPRTASIRGPLDSPQKRQRFSPVFPSFPPPPRLLPPCLPFSCFLFSFKRVERPQASRSPHPPPPFEPWLPSSNLFLTYGFAPWYPLFFCPRHVNLIRDGKTWVLVNPAGPACSFSLHSLFMRATDLGLRFPACPFSGGQPPY